MALPCAPYSPRSGRDTLRSTCACSSALEPAESIVDYDILDFQESLSDAFAVVGFELLVVVGCGGGQDEGVGVVPAVGVEGRRDGGRCPGFAVWGIRVRAVVGLEGGGYLLAEVEILPAAEYEIMLGVLLDALTLVGHRKFIRNIIRMSRSPELPPA
jgi:hypothetical protein